MDYIDKRLIKRLVLYPSWILLLGIAFLSFLDFSLFKDTKILLIFVLGLLFGFPHGATDHLVPFEILGKQKLPSEMFWLLFLYIGLLGFYLWLWFFDYLSAIILFVLLTWIHWGQGELYSLIKYEGAEYSSSFGFLHKLLVIIIRGGIPLIIPILKQPLEITNFISYIGRHFPSNSHTKFLSNLIKITNQADVVHILAISLILLTCLHIFIGYFFSKTHKSKELWKFDLIEILILYFYFLTVTPILAIGIYLFTWHSWRHLARLFLCDANAMSALKKNIVQGYLYFALKAAPTSLIATILVAILYFLLPRVSSGYMNGVVSYLVIISSLTLPHMVVVFWMDIQQGIWKKSEQIKNSLSCSL